MADLTPQQTDEVLAAYEQELNRLRALVRQLGGSPTELLRYADDPIKVLRAYTEQHNVEHQIKVGHARLIWPTEKRSGPYVPVQEGSAHQLWGYIRTNPQWPWNIRVMADGRVDQREGMTQDEINEAEYVLWGGHVYDLDMNGDLYATLVAAGYSFVEGTATP